MKVRMGVQMSQSSWKESRRLSYDETGFYPGSLEFICYGACAGLHGMSLEYMISAQAIHFGPLLLTVNVPPVSLSLLSFLKSIQFFFSLFTLCFCCTHSNTFAVPCLFHSCSLHHHSHSAVTTTNTPVYTL